MNNFDPYGMWKRVNGGWQAERGDTLWGLSSMLYGNGSKWTSFGFNRDPRTLQIGEVIKVGGKSSTTKTLARKRDVTREINLALAPYVAAAKLGRQYSKMTGYTGELGLYKTFYNWVNHGAAWDIKRPKSWVKTIGTLFPGIGTQVIYQGMLMTPEQLGNYTYGYLGAAFGFSLNTLFMGSFYAAGHFNMGGIKLQNEFDDHYYIQLGYINYFK